MVRSVVASILFLTTAMVASAQQSSEWLSCVSARPDVSIQGCGSIIQKGAETPANLGIAHNNRGNAYAKSGKLEQALRDHDDATRLNPTLAAAYYNRGKVYSQTGKFDRAIADFNAALD
ncbi:MAG: tetratricopeptide repeat protein, partial [Hyphomicrobiaceae bacterium]